MNIRTSVSLKNYTTFGIDVTAPRLIQINSVQDYRDYLKANPHSASQAMVLGGGSNVLFVDEPAFDLLQISISGISIEKQDDGTSFVRAGAGVVWHDLVMHTLDANLAGIENLSLIPGCCGAAPMQNIGAYGVELKDVFHSLEAIDRLTGELKTFSPQECRFGYRTSVFKEELKDKYIISAITLRLTDAEHAEVNTSYGAIAQTLGEIGADNPTPRDVSSAVIKIRESKLPDWKKYGNAGSFFKNPVIPDAQFEQLKEARPEVPSYPAGEGFTKVPAGWLIQHAGWKGARNGDAGTWPHQALVLVNFGKASGRELLALARNIRDDVEQKFGIHLEPEVNIIGLKHSDF
ncbi:MAG: UDP-N-acetylmuramate dehydrogenase [Balneolia bacterium]|nr:UDP-N-acetylmuramate dehydrogenase [Balneolia bacterium]